MKTPLQLIGLPIRFVMGLVAVTVLTVIALGIVVFSPRDNIGYKQVARDIAWWVWEGSRPGRHTCGDI